MRDSGLVNHYFAPGSGDDVSAAVHTTEDMLSGIGRFTTQSYMSTHSLCVNNPRRERRECAAIYWELRQAIRRLHPQGLYGAAAILRTAMNMQFNLWNYYRSL